MRWIFIIKTRDEYRWGFILSAHSSLSREIFFWNRFLIYLISFISIFNSLLVAAAIIPSWWIHPLWRTRERFVMQYINLNLSIASQGNHLVCYDDGGDGKRTMCRKNVMCLFPIESHLAYKKSCNQYWNLPEKERRKKRTQSENWQQPKKDIKLKVVKSELQDFQFISNFILFLPSLGCFFHRFTFLRFIFKCVVLFLMLYIHSPSFSSTIISLERKKVWEWKRNRRKTNKIIYCLSICVIFFSITIRTFQLFFSSSNFCPVMLSPFFIGFQVEFLSKWTYQM